MSKKGMESLKSHAENLPEFDSLDSAIEAFKNHRDSHLEILGKISAQQDSFHLDYSPESLKSLESWYFTLHSSNGFEALGISRQTFESCIAMYFGATVVQNVADSSWYATEYFGSGKYENGIKSGCMHYMLTCKFRDLYKLPNNKQRDLLFSEYQHYFGR